MLCRSGATLGLEGLEDLDGRDVVAVFLTEPALADLVGVDDVIRFF
ncbi:MAG: hypothetical protein RR326_00665 [Stenotrophomonas sp.]